MVTLKLTHLFFFLAKNTLEIYVIDLIIVVKKIRFYYLSLYSYTYLLITQTIVLIVGKEK